jgi:hypothetical protein
LEDRKAPQSAGRADELTTDDVRPGNLAGRAEESTSGEVTSEWHQAQVESAQEVAEPSYQYDLTRQHGFGE